MMYFYHHSRLLSCRRPQGAAAISGTVALTARQNLPQGSKAFVRLWQEGGQEVLVPMVLEAGLAKAEIQLPDAPCLVWYFFLLELPEGKRLYYGADSGEGRLMETEPPAYQITVYDPSFTTPAPWREGVCYQIFPDRFRRSSWEDFRNRAHYHTHMGRKLRIHDRWDEEPLTEPAAGQQYYSPDDFFGGDFNGIREKLPYLKSLGVTYIYLNPIFESCSNHRYNTSNYHRTDPILGSEEEFAQLAAAAREQGIRIILDGVFSHTGDDSIYFNKQGRYHEKGACQGTDSPYYDWYDFKEFPDTYDCWWGFDSLPNVKELTPSYVDFITGEHGVIAHWMGHGLGGWRLDVADELPDDFIRHLRRAVKKQDPDAVLIGEVWEDCSNKFGPEGRRDYVDGDLLDSTMNYPLKEALVDFLTGRTDAYGFTQATGLLREHYPKPFFDACMNLLSSHDDVRLLYMLAGSPARNVLSREEQKVYRPSEENLALARRRIPLAFALILCHPGVPTLYYGDEIGLPGMSDPFNRATYPWGKEDTALLKEAQKLFPLRQAQEALKNGLTRMGAVNPSVFAILRYLPDSHQVALLLVNAGLEEERFTFSTDLLSEGPDGETPVPFGGSYREIGSDESLFLEEGCTLTLPPVSYRLFIKGE